MCCSLRRQRISNYRWTDSRRVTGPNHIWNGCGAVLEVSANPDLNALIQRWDQQAHDLLRAVGWDREFTRVRVHTQGASLALSAPLDALYAACDLNELAWDCAVEDKIPSIREVEHLKRQISEETRPGLKKLQQAARSHQLPLLFDDDECSVGYGKASQTWPSSRLPDPENVNWSSLGTVPVVVVTGTNGKTTTVRLLRAIGLAADEVPGISSTDAVVVGDRIIDHGDYSGPGGARTVLRNTDVSMAVLETARGGLVRRGLGVPQADVTILTNIGDDHLGESGIETLDDLADVKAVITHALIEGSVAVANWDDPLIRVRALALPAARRWFSTRAPDGLLLEQIKQGDEAWCLADGQLCRYTDGQTQRLLGADEVPLTLGGAAKHNAANALAAAAAAQSIGISEQAIISALKQFGSSETDNPGRSNVFQVDGVTVLMDFAHNPDGVQAIMNTARAIPHERLLATIGQAGDRADESIVALAQCTYAAKPDRIIIKHMDEFRRGRKKHAVSDLIHRTLLKLGAQQDILEFVDSEMDAVNAALQWGQPGDLIILIVHSTKEAVLNRLKKLSQ